jgi:F-type H+-transporting ATPase subunit delta
MAENSTIARPYAEALFEATTEMKADLHKTAEQLEALVQLLEVEDMRQALSDPRFEDSQRSEFVRIGLNGIDLLPQVQNFVDLLISNDRMLLLPDICLQFNELKDHSEGVAQAHIVSAFPMQEHQVADLIAALEPKFKVKLKPHVTIDESLIGGVRVVVGDHVLDTSVQAQLHRLREALVA